MNKTDGISILQRQIDELKTVKATARFGPTFQKWQRDTKVALLKIFEGDERQAREFDDIRFYPPVITDKTSEYLEERAYMRGLEEAEAFLESCIREINDYWSEKDRGQECRFDPFPIIEKICSRFHLVARQLRNRYDNRPTIAINDEYDIQDLLHGILRIFFDDIRPEEWTPSYAGKSSRMDFLIKDFKIVIEVKMARKGLRGKEIGTQLIDDIARYRQHQECNTLICFVYDPEGVISNPAGLERDLSTDQDGFRVRIITAPR